MSPSANAEPAEPRVILTCEHAAAHVPRALARSFAGAERTLASHRGSDLGALELARELARARDARGRPLVEEPLFATRVTRLVCDANRSRTSPALFSEYTRGLAPAERERLLALHWEPHRSAVTAAVAAALAATSGARVRRATAACRVVHVGVHSFTPRLAGVVRAIDVALLYDPARAPERELATAWLSALDALWPGLRLRRNAPYRGTTDGLVRNLRRLHGPRRYAGLELEVSQRFPLGDPARWRALRAAIARSFATALGR